MTIKRRFLISYIGGIFIASASLLVIICILFYVTTGTVPTPNTLYQEMAKQRSLSADEELAYIELRNVAKTDPDKIIYVEQDLAYNIQHFESKSLGVVIRKDEDIVYYSEGLVEKSLIAHFPQFDANNLETKGTIQNVGRLYRYIKFDFYFSDQTKGSLLILKKENNLLEFMTKWGIVIIVAIVCISVAGVAFMNYLLKKSIISPLESLGTVMAELKEGELVATPIEKMEHTAKEIQQLTMNFENMRDALIESIKEQRNLENNRKELIASISHDLKTPITSIIGYVEGLQEGVADTPQKQEKYLQTIHAKALALNHLIEELFLYSKLDAEAITFHYERINLVSFLQHVVEELQLIDRQVSIQMQTTKEPLYVAIDRMQMNRAIMNLIENSMKFKKGGEPLTILLDVYKDGAYVVLRIVDNGQGIPKEQLPYVFDRFYRGEEARTTDTGGSGLGLAIVQQIIEKHGGNVDIQSEQMMGTIVSIALEEAK
ncbi:HAMP domain-containing sensor histidine kinase [Metasolibacillus meyeri]|uniref:histidine kinase n=1 Tax=Metasolibacillus meyeri TaxID=1071052 RepID=A0AAW9NRQ4_9BACL|nr:HAMP domain-containing sensor histidine kinase [Metasolibacillus meyeri]MEC1178379.1 HAMP domain-containing sensor histidine kinase [Metasolibacillus meyeri]